MPTVKLNQIHIRVQYYDGELQTNLAEVSEHANWLERWAIAFVYRLLDRLFIASYKVAEDIEDNL